MSKYAYFEYLDVDESKLFTMIALPAPDGKFPTIICRSPYVKSAVEKSENELTQDFLQAYSDYVERGYAVVFQHCKGCGKSTGEFIPYVHEREDGISLRQWIRTGSFYNGELFLMGASYTASLHYATAPFEEDIFGAIFEVQDSERYRLWYRNGQMRKGHANWHFDLYKSKSLTNKNFSMQSFSELPLKGLSKRALGEYAEDFEKMLLARFPNHEFWQSRNGGIETRDAVTNANIPILLTTGYNDFYIGGVFEMWNKMDAQTKKQSALLVSPYNHGDGYDVSSGLSFPRGKRVEQFGKDYKLDWLEHIRKNTPIGYEKGVITYYRTFENEWQSDFYKNPTKNVTIKLGEFARSFEYDPYNPTAFASEGRMENEVCSDKFIRVYTKPLEKDVFVKGQMKVFLVVSSSCEDSSFYVRVAIKKPQGKYVLRHDVTSLSYQIGSYRANEKVEIEFCFDEHAFSLKKDECLQVDIASTDDNTYVSHTNTVGEYHLKTEAKTAKNTVYLDESYLILPIEI